MASSVPILKASTPPPDDPVSGPTLPPRPDLKTKTSTPADEPALKPIVPPRSDLNTTASTPADVSIPAILFAIPFPAPVRASEDASKVAKRPAFLLYAPPRAAYRKPEADGSGPPAKESFVKRMESKWQGEVSEGRAIERGTVTDPTTWQKAKGALTRVRAVLCLRAPCGC
jgi:hypothetical protein